MTVVELTRSRGHLILGETPEEGTHSGSSVDLSRGVPPGFGALLNAAASVVRRQIHSPKCRPIKAPRRGCKHVLQSIEIAGYTPAAGRASGT